MPPAPKRRPRKRRWFLATIASNTIKVSVADPHHPDLLDEDGSQLFGVYYHERGEIILDGTQPAGIIEETLMHEFDHCISRLCGLPHAMGDSLGIDPAKWEKHEETLLRVYSPARYDAYRRNRLLRLPTRPKLA